MAVREADASLSNWDARVAMRLFDASQSQWRAAFDRFTGLDYMVVKSIVAPLLDVTVTPEVFRFLQLLEAEQLAEWAKQSDERRKKASAAPGRSPSRGVRHG